MLGIKSFFAMTPAQADGYLHRLRPRQTPRNALCVIIVTKAPDERSSKGDTNNEIGVLANYSHLSAICNEEFNLRKGMIPETGRNGVIDLLRCAWFHKSSLWDAINAASAIRNRLRCKLKGYSSVMAVGKDEYASFQLIEECGEWQIIIDPRIWISLSEKFRDFAESNNIHPPGQRNRGVRQVKDPLSGSSKTGATADSSRRKVTLRS
jgi:hypothetical protein